MPTEHKVVEVVGSKTIQHDEGGPLVRCCPTSQDVQSALTSLQADGWKLVQYSGQIGRDKVVTLVLTREVV